MKGKGLSINRASKKRATKGSAKRGSPGVNGGYQSVAKTKAVPKKASGVKR